MKKYLSGSDTGVTGPLSKRPPGTTLHLSLAAALYAALSGLVSAQSPQPPQSPKGPWMDKSLSPDQRADLVAHQMTLDEKLSLLHGSGWQMLFAGPDSPPSKSLGNAGYISGIPRLGIPDLQMADAAVGVTRGGGYRPLLHGAALRIAEAASWDLEAGPRIRRADRPRSCATRATTCRSAAA